LIQTFCLLKQFLLALTGLHFSGHRTAFFGPSPPTPDFVLFAFVFHGWHQTTYSANSPFTGMMRSRITFRFTSGPLPIFLGR
jgi:hypothetical protein